jgi:hypothetical protein
MTSQAGGVGDSRVKKFAEASESAPMKLTKRPSVGFVGSVSGGAQNISYLNRDEVPCSVATFERLLYDAGLFLADGLVSGLTLKRDWESYKSSKRSRDTRSK